MMEENASALPPSECNAALLMLSISSEDEREFPEAVSFIRSLASSLGPNGESPELLAELQKEKEELREINGVLIEKMIFICATKEVLREEQLNGYQRLPQDVVEKLMDAIVLTEMNKKYKGSLNNVLGVSTDVITPVGMTESQKSILMNAIEDKILQLDGPTDGKERVDEAEKKLIHTQLLFNAKKKEHQELERKVDESLQKLIKIKNDKMENDKMDFEIKKLQLEIDIYKKKIADIRVAKELYGDGKVEALTKLAADKKEEVKKAREENQKLRDKLALYSTLPKEEFDPIVKQYQEVCKQVEDAKWSIKKMEEGGD